MAGVTGTYVFDKKLGRLVKISDKAHCPPVDVTCPASGYYSENLETFVRSRRHKKQLLKERGLAEAYDGSAHHVKRR